MQRKYDDVAVTVKRKTLKKVKEIKNYYKETDLQHSAKSIVERAIDILYKRILKKINLKNEK